MRRNIAAVCRKQFCALHNRAVYTAIVTVGNVSDVNYITLC